MARKSKIMTRKRIIIMVAAVTLLAVFVLSVFVNTHGIPNGRYGSDIHGGVKHNEEFYSDWCWRVRGNRVYYYASGWLTYKGKIIEKDGRLYFKLYTVNGQYSKKSGDPFEYEIKYEKTTKSLTVYLTSEPTFN
jgi:hypothetical protein